MHFQQLLSIAGKAFEFICHIDFSTYHILKQKLIQLENE